MLGPKLTDERLFGELIDTTRPGLRAIPGYVAQGNYAAARHALATDVRQTLQPDRFPYAPGEQYAGNTSYMLPDESLNDAVERVMTNTLVSCGTPHQFGNEIDWFINPTFNQYKEWTWQLSRHWEWGLLGARYRETGDERLAQSFVFMFQSWVQQAIVPEPTPGNDTLCWRTIEAGIRMGQSWHNALHSFIHSPHVTDDVLVDWVKSIWEHGWRLRNFFWRFNWVIMEMNGLGQIGILYPQLKDASAWKQYAIERLERELALQNFADGFQYELTTNYHQVNIRNYQLLWNVMETHDEPVPPTFRAELEKMHDVHLHLMMPDGCLPSLSDGNYLQVAELMKDAVRCYPARDDFRWAYTQGEAGSPPERRSYAFDYSGYYVMRTGWDADALWVLFDGGHLGSNHQHEDKLNILLHAYGRLLLTEGGNYAYDDSEMRRYVLSTRAHNTIRIDGLDQNRKGPFRARWQSDNLNDDDIIRELNTPNDATWHTTAAYDLAAATYREGYGPDVDAIATHQRTVIFLKQPPPGIDPCLVVIDRLTPLDADPHTVEILWHTNTNELLPSADNPLAVASADAGQANLAVITADHPALRLDVVSAQESPEWQGWQCHEHGRQKSEFPAPTAIYRLKTTGAQRIVTLIYPLAADMRCPITHISTSPDPADTLIRLHLRDGAIIGLDERDFPA